MKSQMATPISDTEDLQRFVACGDERAFAQIVERHLRLVHGAAMRVLGNREAAQEVSQSVFILLARRAYRLTSHPTLAGWLYRTAALEARQYRRSQARREQREQLAASLGLTMQTEESSVAALQSELDEAMLKLRTADREALVLRYFSEKSVREVGEALGIREDAAQKRLSKALDALTRSFRRRGLRVAAPTITALVLQKAAVSAAVVPAGMGATIAHTAVAAAPALSFGVAAASAAKIMSLTKIQTTMLCTALAIAPLGYEWHAISAARALNEQLSGRVGDLRRRSIAVEEDRIKTERRIGELERKLTKSVPVPAQTDAPAEPEPAVWDDHSPFVRLPRALLAKVRFTGSGTAPAADGKEDRFALPALTVNGEPQPALEAALGLSAAETAQFRQACRAAFAEFNARMAQHTVTTRPQIPDRESVRIDVAAFPEEGAAFQQRMRERLTAILGPERTEAFWQQAAGTFRDAFHDFGATPSGFELIRDRDGHLDFMLQSHQSSRLAKFEDLRGFPVPLVLQPTADAWSKAATQRMGGAR